jgi:diguanylate cyclase (GGDEF)-like protein
MPVRRRGRGSVKLAAAPPIDAGQTLEFAARRFAILIQPGCEPSVTTDAPLSILLAEDDPVTRMLLTRALKKAGYAVDAVADGTAALDKAIHRYYPILITDWEMPQMDGIELCRAVRGLQLDGYVYLLLLTARDAKEHMIAGLEAGADDYLIKPIYEPELFARLNTGRRILALEHSLRAANEQNRLLSMTDALTHAFNRRHLMEQLPREFERCRRYGYPISLVMCDIDHFKSVNDVHGHAVGDEILREFVRRIGSSIRSASDWIARYGGEEFVFVLPETRYEGAVVVAEKIRTLLAGEPFATEAGPVSVTASFGVASTGSAGPDLGVSPDALLGAADSCLYRSKHGGRNQVSGLEIVAATSPPESERSVAVSSGEPQ